MKIETEFNHGDTVWYITGEGWSGLHVQEGTIDKAWGRAETASGTMVWYRMLQNPNHEIPENAVARTKEELKAKIDKLFS